jgi:hypothetical protein
LKSTGAVNAGFEINDIQIIYREKAVRWLKNKEF